MRGPSVPVGGGRIVSIREAVDVPEDTLGYVTASNERHTLAGRLPLREVTRPAPTMVKTGNSRMMVGRKIVPISNYEASRFSSFLDQYVFASGGSVNERVGNSVPPLLMHAIARHIRSEVLMDTSTQKKQHDRRPYKQVLDDLWTAHQAPREPDAPTVVSLFAGAGGSSLGYSAAGFRELLAVEWDAHACRCLRQNFPGLTVFEGDVGKLSVEEALELAGIAPGELDVLDGSPPCQGFSTAGKRMMDDPRNQLFREYVRLLEGFRPRVFVMENVSGMVKGKMKLVFAEILWTLRGAGYTVGAWLLNAMHYGVPQSRERMIFVGVRSDLVGAGPGVPEGDVSKVTFEDATGDRWSDGIDLAFNPDTLTAQAMRKAKQGEQDPKHYSTRKMHAKKPVCTLRHDFLGYFHYWHPVHFRPLTLIEWSRCGSFPDQYLWEDKKKSCSRIGNSVPPLLMHRIASHVREAILIKLEAPF